MNAFSHVLTLVGFAFAFSLTQLLARVGALALARDRVKSPGLTSLGFLAAMLLVYVNWLSMWELRDGANWTLASITAIFLFTLAVCFVCMVTAPDARPEGAIDLDEFYWRHRKVFYWAWLICELLATITNIALLNSPSGGKLFRENMLNIAMFPPIILALSVRKRWAQWVGVIGLILAHIGFLFMFERRLD
jgi:hypothetical protein